MVVKKDDKKEIEDKRSKDFSGPKEKKVPKENVSPNSKEDLDSKKTKKVEEVVVETDEEVLEGEVITDEKEEKVEKKTEEKAEEKKEKKEKKEEVVMKLSDLPGVGPAAVEKLESAGIFDLMGVAVMGPKELSEMAGMGEAAARKAIQASRGMMDLGFTDGMEFAEKRKEVVYIGTGSVELNNLLGGKGIET